MAVFYGLAMLFYTPITYPDQGTAQEVRPGLVGALTWAPRACPMAAVGCSAAALAAIFYVVCGALFYEYLHSLQPIGATRLRPGSSGDKSEQSCVGVQQAHMGHGLERKRDRIGQRCK